jgi:hypothetical protein
MSKLAALAAMSVMALLDTAPSCKPIHVDECAPYRRLHEFYPLTDYSRDIGLRMYVRQQGNAGEFNEPKEKCSIVPDESYEVVTCPGADLATQGENFPGCGDVFCVRVRSNPLLWYELEVPETGCDPRYNIQMEGVELEATP